MKPSIFIDTDVVLDFLLDREPYSSFASIIFTHSEERKNRTYISPLTVGNCYYVLRRLASHNKVIGSLQKLLVITNITSISKRDVVLALNSKFRHLENALQHHSAISHSKIDVILTGIIKDYKKSEIPVMTPETYMKTYNFDSSS